MGGHVATALTIAGSDSGGGAGIQADLKTFSALGVFGTSAITAITAQNTRGVVNVQTLTLDIIGNQIDAVIDDIGADAVKTGMLATAEIVTLVADRVLFWAIDKLVVDPVMVAKSGQKLLSDEAVIAIREILIPLALVVTPNLEEAEVLVGRSLPTDADIRLAAQEIVQMGARWVVMKGGHRPGNDVIDLLTDGERFWEFRAVRIQTKNTHGTGCTFAAAIAARLAVGDTVPDAVELAKRYLHAAIVNARPIGKGHGPVHHFHRWY